MTDSVEVHLDETLQLPRAEGAGADVAPPEPGSLLGRFEVQGELGRGGMGAVVSGRDPELRRTVAIKVSSRTLDRERLGRFVAEAQITAQLEHPNIVPVYELGVTDEGELY